MKWISLEHAKANLVEFLKDYSQTFNENNLNPSCEKCLERYFNNFKNLNKMENTCKYRLHAKYNGIQLDFGSNIFVTNDNITDKLAKELIKNPDFNNAIIYYIAGQSEELDELILELKLIHY
jgi:hypothetical protein